MNKRPGEAADASGRKASLGKSLMAGGLMLFTGATGFGAGLILESREHLQTARELNASRKDLLSCNQRLGASISEQKSGLEEYEGRLHERSELMEKTESEMVALGADYLAVARDRAMLRAAAREIFGKSPEQVGGGMESAMELFDWFSKNIEYAEGTIPRRGPKETYEGRKGDCDEQAMLFVGIMEAVARRSTRMVRLKMIKDGKEIGHAYPQVRVGDFSDGSAGLDRIQEALGKRYGFDPDKAKGLGDEGADFDRNGIWFTFDTTGELPGQRMCTPKDRECMPMTVLYETEPGSMKR